MTTVSGGVRQTKLQAEVWEAIGGDREQAQAKGVGPGWNIGGGVQGYQVVNEDSNSSTLT